MGAASRHYNRERKAASARDLPERVTVICDHCGQDRTDHYLLNFADGPLVGQYVLICPTNVFAAQGYDAAGERS